MTHSKFPWTTHPHTPTAVFDGDGRRIIDQWVAPAEGARELGEELREYTAMKYAGNCKCGKCQLVPRELVERIYHTLNGTLLFPTPLDPETAAANAVMIAAIPEMVEALEDARDFLSPASNRVEWRLLLKVKDVLASIGRAL